MSTGLATHVTTALAGRLAAIDRCLAGKPASVRAMLSLLPDGTLLRARVGGSGSAIIEDCVARAIGELALPPPGDAVELACDLSTGGDTPWRVTPERYTVIDVGSSELRIAGNSIAEGAPPLTAEHGYLVLADAAAPARLVDRALALTAPGWPVLVAIHASGGAPVFVGLAGDTPATSGVTLAPQSGSLATCGRGQTAQRPALVDVRAVDRALAATLAACATPCERVARIATAGPLVAKELVAAASAARRAGLDPLVVRGAGCTDRSPAPER